jgi:hypothetical protein
MASSVRLGCRERGIGAYGNVTRRCTSLEDSSTAGILIYSMVSTDLVTRRAGHPYTPVTILATDDKPDDTVLRDCA